MLGTVRCAGRLDVLKIFAFLAATLALAALIAPLLFNSGKALALAAEASDSALVRWLGDAARALDFRGFFDRALLISGLLLVFPLIQWLRPGRADGHLDEVQQQSVSAAVHPRASVAKYRLRRDPRGPLNLLAGFLLGASVLLLFGLLLTQTGSFSWRQDLHWGGVLRAVVPATLFFAIVGEVLFRGVLLGVFLRAFGPVLAVGVLSLLFAFVHFLQPAAGVVVADPAARWAGFVMLGGILGQLADSELLLHKGAILVAVGVVLGYARLRSGALWLPVGLHAGWVFAILLFERVAQAAEGADPGVWTGGSLREGLVPLVLISATAGLVYLLTIDYSDATPQRDE